MSQWIKNEERTKLTEERTVGMVMIMQVKLEMLLQMVLLSYYHEKYKLMVNPLTLTQKMIKWKETIQSKES